MYLQVVVRLIWWPEYHSDLEDRVEVVHNRQLHSLDVYDKENDKDDLNLESVCASESNNLKRIQSFQHTCLCCLHCDMILYMTCFHNSSSALRRFEHDKNNTC